jgi:anti-anti-sigma factor
MRGRLADLVFETNDNVVLARIRGEVDASNASEIRVALIDRLSNDAAGLVLDLSGTSYLDSTGISLLFELARGLGARRQRLRLAVPRTAPIRRVLELCDVASVAPLDEAVEASLSAFEA